MKKARRQTARNCFAMRLTPDRLRKEATEALKNAYARYSGFQVGAALLTEAGNLYTGCNVENISYGLTICAERVAIGNAVAAEGKKMRIKAIAIAAKQVNEVNGKNELVIRDVSPCGACRQVIVEFADKPRHVYYRHEGELVSRTVDELVPDAFFPPSLAT